MGYAARLGSDCAFFCQDNPMMGTGRGEILSPAPVSLKGYFLLLIKPPVHVSTAGGLCRNNAADSFSWAGHTPSNICFGVERQTAE